MSKSHALLCSVLIGVIAPVMTGGCTASRSAAQPQFGATSSLLNAISSPFSDTSGGTSLFSWKPPHVGGAVPASYSEPVQTADPTSLSTEAKPSPRLHVAMAKLHEKSNQFAMAEEQYRQALQMDAKYLDALLGLGRLQDRQGDFQAALNTYQRAVKHHPENAAAWNHLGLCLARQGRLADAADSLQKAVNLEPRRELYRTNLAVIFVEAGRTEDALRQLRAVQEEAEAYYNLAYLLQKTGDSATAARYFNLALQRKPDFEEARQWLELLRAQNDNSLIAQESRAGRAKQPVSLPEQPAHPSDAGANLSGPSQSAFDDNEGRRPSPFRLPFFSHPTGELPALPSGKGNAMPGGRMTEKEDSAVGSRASQAGSPTPGSQLELNANTSRSVPPVPLPPPPQPRQDAGRAVSIEVPKTGRVVAPLPPVLAEPSGEVQPLPPITNG
ncbi:MAG: tetratricopeptide repeat protein [Thermogutta sp.]